MHVYCSMFFLLNAMCFRLLYVGGVFLLLFFACCTLCIVSCVMLSNCCWLYVVRCVMFVCCCVLCIVCCV